MIKLLIFDLDGTIADTLQSIREALNMTMDVCGAPHRSYDEVKDAIGSGVRELIRRSLPRDMSSDDVLIDRLHVKYNGLYDETYSNIDGCYPLMYDTIRTLRERGFVLAVLSNKPDKYTKSIINMLFLDGEFSFVAGQTELPRKPDPTVALMIAERLGVSPCECAFIGDNDVDVNTAKNAGMTSVACAWGYRPISALTDADHIIESADALLNIFKQERS